MKRIKLITLLGIVLLLAACSSDESDSGSSFQNLVSDSSEALDERSVIEEAFVKQKDLLKLGFLTGEETLSQSMIQYTPAEDELEYTERIDVTGDRDELTINVVANDRDDNMSYEYDTIANETAIDVADTEAIIGDYNEYNAILAKGDRVTYALTHYSEVIDHDVMELIGRSLKTEAQGAPELLYDRMSLDLGEVHFPSLANEKVAMEYVTVNYTERGGTIITVRYETDDNHRLTYKVSDQLWDNGELEASEEELDGVVVDIIKDEDTQKFQWIDGDYFYEVSYSNERSPSSHDDIFAIVQSAMADERSFDSLAFLENSGEASRKLSDVDQQLQALLSENSAVAAAEQEAERDERLEEDRLAQLEIDKQEVPDEYPDHLRLGDSHRWQRNDGIGKTDVETTVNSFELLEEINGVEPEEGVFLVVNITIEDLLGGSTFYTESFVRGLAYDSSGATYRRYELDNGYDALGDYEGKLPEEYSGSITGTVVFDIEPSNYYRVDILDGNWLLFEDEKANE